MARHAKHTSADRKTMEQQLLFASHRLAAIGELAGLVGHDLRNPLTSMKGAIYYLRRTNTHKMSDKEKEMFDILDKGIDYSNKIINDLLDYSGEIHPELEETTPKALIKSTLSMTVIPSNIQIIDETEGRPIIQVDVNRLNRAICNIIKNAIDAMPMGGKLELRSAQSNNNVKFIFSDTGAGMTEETITKLWTPLYTTKAKGMGFGLSISKRIIEAHGGTIKANSTLGKGSTFEFAIPTNRHPNALAAIPYKYA
jgi:signal transduction histidine kinase